MKLTAKQKEVILAMRNEYFIEHRKRAGNVWVLVKEGYASSYLRKQTVKKLDTVGLLEIFEGVFTDTFGLSQLGKTIEL